MIICYLHALTIDMRLSPAGAFYPVPGRNLSRLTAGTLPLGEATAVIRCLCQVFRHCRVLECYGP